MKKSIFYLSVLAVAATTLFACNKLEVKQEAVNEPQTVTFNAGVAPITKTTFGALNVNKYPTIWTENDANVKIAQNFSAGQDAAVTKVSDSQATFAATFSDDASGSYTFYAVSPASAVVSGVSSSYKSWNLEIPTDQTPTTTGPDEGAMIMVASSSTVGTFPTSVDLSFTHLTAYAKMSITNLALDGGDQIASVLITGSNNIAYRYYYYVGGDKVGTLEENSAQNYITVHTTSTSNIWFACAPMATGTQLTIAVTTANSKVYTKSGINIPSALAAGEVAVFNVDFNGITAAENKVYNLVKNYTELTDGSKVIISALGDADYAMGIMTSSGNKFADRIATSKSADDQTITNPGANVDVFTLEAGTEDNTIAFKGTNGYLYAYSSTSNEMSVQATNNANGSWTPTIDTSTGETILKANGDKTRCYIKYNADYNRFSCYGSTSALPNVAVYKLVGSGSSTQLYDNLKLKQVTITAASGDDTGFTATWEKPDNAPASGVTYTYTLYQGTDATGTLVVSSTVTDALTLTDATALSDGQYYLTIVASATGYTASAPAGRGFTVATGGGGATTWTHTFVNTDNLSGTSVVLSGKTWTPAVTWKNASGYWGFDATKGHQIGSKNNPATAFTLSSSDFTGTVTKVIVNSSTASGGTAKLKVYVNNVQWGSEISLTASATDYTFTGSGSGEIKIDYTNTAAAFYIKSLSVTTE